MPPAVDPSPSMSDPDPRANKSCRGGSCGMNAVLRSRAVFAIVLAVVAIGGGLALWNNVLRDRLFPKNFGVVEQGTLFRSAQISGPLIRDVIRQNGLKTVIDLNSVEPTLSGQSEEIQACRDLKVELLRFPLRGDGTGDITQYANAIEAIERCRKEGKPVLVHCAAGTQRTGGVIASYRLLVQHKSPAQAYEEMIRHKWDPRDDVALMNYLDANMRTLAKMLVDRNVIDRVPDPLPLPAPADQTKSAS